MDPTKALAGVRVLDFTHYLAGPFATFQLALQGADVIKVEPLAGDDMRASAVAPEWSERRMGPGWMSANANKRSLTLDLSKPRAVEIVERLAAQVDVVCENFRPGVMERRGIGWPQLSKVNPKLIYCGISGFGSTGPERRTASFDGKIQAMSGLMSINGEPAGGPMRVGYATADITAGITSAFAIACALFQRTHTGRGQFVDVAMLDASLSFLCMQVAEYSVAGVRHAQAGNGSVSRKPTADRFRCGDGFIVLAVLTDRQFESLMNTLGRADALADPRFADWPARIANAQPLRAVIEDAMREGDPKAWERRLTDADVPCATVHTIPEILAHPQVAHREFLRTADTPWGPVKLGGAGFRLEHGDGGFDRPVARPGEHTDEVLRGAGYTDAQIAELRAASVIGARVEEDARAGGGA